MSEQSRAEAGERSLQSLIARVHVDRSIVRMAILLALAFTCFAILRPAVFLNTINLQNLMVAAPEIGVLAIAMAIAMLTGGIDLSVVGIANLTAITVSTTFTAIAGDDPQLAESLGPLLLVLGLLVGVGAGIVNAFLIAALRITPILATLATMQIFNGIAIVWTGGKTLYGAPEAMTSFGRSTWFSIPLLFLLFLLVAAFVGILISRTPFGMRTQLQGANATAARYSGIRGARVLFGTYILVGVLGAIAGLFILSRNPTASADYGSSYILLAIVIAVLGGTNPNGGFATVTGVVLATLVLGVVQSGFTALRLSSYEYAIAQGVILIAVMVIDQVRFRRRRTNVAPAAAAASGP